MKSLARYAFTNSRVRALLSYLLTEADYEAMVKAQDLAEFISLAKETAYRDIFSAPLNSIEPEEVEQQLLRRAVGIHQRIAAGLSGRAREVIYLLLQRYEIATLKKVLCLWHKREKEEFAKISGEEKICFVLPLLEIINAASLEEIILLLDHTPYRQALLAGRSRYKSSRNIFYLEINLDLDFYLRLWKKIKELGVTDRQRAAKLLGIEIDAKNISSLIRFKQFYKLPLAEVVNFLIPGGYQIKEQLLRSVYGAGSEREIIRQLAVKTYQGLEQLLVAEQITDNLSLLEVLLGQIMVHEARQALAGWPFTIGTVLSYLILLQIEMGNIISLYYGKNYGREPEMIKGSLIV